MLQNLAIYIKKNILNFLGNFNNFVQYPIWCKNWFFIFNQKMKNQILHQIGLNKNY